MTQLYVSPRKRIQEHALNFPCGTDSCQATAGARCVTSTGATTAIPHANRIAKAKDDPEGQSIAGKPLLALRSMARLGKPRRKKKRKKSRKSKRESSPALEYIILPRDEWELLLSQLDSISSKLDAIESYFENGN